MLQGMSLRDAALLLLGHGSTLNADSSAPTYQHAEEIRRRGIFAEVHVAFWKEEPNFRQALRQTNCRQVYVVPNFISSGYFTEQVIPRELGLTGPVTHLPRQDVFYCQPVGLHSSMTEALLQRAEHVVAESKATIPEPAKTACLFICGHGTSMNDNSTKIIHEQAEVIRKRGLFADCQGVLMEQKPFVKDWRTLTTCPDVIVVPFFISDGLHSFEDIPVLLGLTHNMKEQGFTNPHQEESRKLWYANAIGTESFIADVILAQVEQFKKEHAVAEPDGPASSMIEDAFVLHQYENPPPWRIGEVVIGKGFQLHHYLDRADDPALRRLSGVADLRELVRLDEAGHFRPLHAAPNLRRGWIYRAADVAGLRLAFDYLYPGELANWAQWTIRLPATPWHKTAERQTGRFRIIRELDEAAVRDLVATYCDKGCLKRRLWAPAAQSVEAVAHEIPLLCPEACNFLVEKARAKLKGTEEE